MTYTRNEVELFKIWARLNELDDILVMLDLEKEGLKEKELVFQRLVNEEKKNE